MSYAPVPDAGPPVAPPGWYRDQSGQSWWWWDGWRWIAPDPTPPSGPTWFPATPTLQLPAALLGIGFVVALTIATRAVVLLPDTASQVASLALVAVSTLGMPLAAWFGSHRWGTGRFVDDLGFRFGWLDAPLGLAGAIALTISLTVLNVVTHLIGLPSGSNLTEVSERGRDGATFLVLFVMAGLLAPLTEELLFRGLILCGLSSRLSPWTAVVVQGLVFGAAHFTPSQGWGNLDLCLSLAVMGIGLGAVARSTGRLGTGVITHAVFNCLQLGLLWISLK